MAEIKQFQHHSQKQAQKQNQKLTQKQIQAVSFLAMSSKDLREEILRMAEENDAIEIVSDPFTSGDNFQRSLSPSSLSADDYNSILEQQSDNRETLQKHLMDQIHLQRISASEEELCRKLIYNLDKDGFYGSKIKPETLLDPSQPQQNLFMLKKCMSLIQQLDPVGTCCKDVFESLKVQSEVLGNASVFTKFILDGNLELLNAGSTEKILKKVKDFQKDWHSKAFATDLPIDNLKITEQMVEETFSYIRQLNPYPASDYLYDASGYDNNIADVVLKIEKKSGSLASDEIENGKIRGDGNSYFQVKYSSGIIPEIKLVNEKLLDRQTVSKAKDFIDNLQFMKNTFVLQGCFIVKEQLDFFEKGPGNIAPLTRKKIAGEVGVHESTVSRFSSKKNSKYLETPWGIFPASYFFSSGVKMDQGSMVSAEAIKSKILELISLSPSSQISDSKLTRLLNEQGIEIARRTVAKYRSQLGIENSYNRK